MRRWFFGILLTLVFGTMGTLAGAESTPPPAPKPQDTVAQVNGKIITYEDLDHQFLGRTRVPFEQVQADPRAQEVRKQILNQIIDDELLVQQAEREKLQVPAEAVQERLQNVRARFSSDDDFKKALSSTGMTEQQLKEDIRGALLRQEIINREVLNKVSVAPAELKPFFQKHQDNYVQEEAVHARHILIKLAPNASPEDDQKAKARANAILAKVKKGEDFAKLAAENSDGPSKERGGDLGYFSRGKMVKDFEDAVFKLKVAQISDLVRTQFGYHIIKVEDKREAKRFTYDEVKDRVENDLKREKAIARYEEYTKALRKQAKLTINLK